MPDIPADDDDDFIAAVEGEMTSWEDINALGTLLDDAITRLAPVAKIVPGTQAKFAVEVDGVKFRVTVEAVTD